MIKICKCVICNSIMQPLFEITIFKESRLLLECQNPVCRQASFDTIDWLEIAYSNAISDLDTGAVRRCLSMRKLVGSIVTLLGDKCAQLVDYGGGAGLLTRLLRDIGIDAYAIDKYCENIYAGSFKGEKQHYDFVTMIEVLEHLSNPVDELSSIVEIYTPDYIVATTVLKPRNMDQSWWYLTPETGQHINFYTKGSIKILAQKIGYGVFLYKGAIVFIKGELNIKKKIMFYFATNRYMKNIIFLFRSLFFIRSTQKDFENLRLK